jgi:3-methyladenine DNA glycosylase AlkD
MQTLQEKLVALGNPEKALLAGRYFKTGKGEYAEGDIFIGITMPTLRETIKPYFSLSFEELQTLLTSPLHECRMAALLIMVRQYEKGTIIHRRHLAEFYLQHTAYINNWDLVDSSAHKIIGAYLFDKDRSLLYDLADSKHLWSERISVVATAYFIAKKQFSDTFQLSEKFLTHRHDLMHKACGWMLREVGKKNEEALKEFLDEHVAQMPRTMLRYAIERFPEKERKYYLNQ